MKYRFYAKPGHVNHWPASMRTVGQRYAYICRDMVAGDPAKGTAATHPAKREPTEVDDEHPDADARIRADRVKELAKRDGAFYAADQETAVALGVEFVPVEYGADQEWHAKSAISKPTKSKE